MKNVLVYYVSACLRHAFHHFSECVLSLYIIIIHLFGLQFKFIHAEDGSGKGAALVSAIAQRIKKRLQ